MLKLHELRAMIEQNVVALRAQRPLATEYCAVGQQVLGKILAKAVFAPFDLPRFDVSAMDGYAVADTVHSCYNVVGESIAGKAYDGVLSGTNAVRIMTGAPVPASAHAVIMQENVIRQGQSITLKPDTTIRHNDNIRKQGEEVTTNELLLPEGRVLSTADIMLLCSMGISHVDVYKPLQVGVMTTGDELVQVGSSLQNDQIYDCNRPLLLAELSLLPIDVIDLGCVPDDADQLRYTMHKASQTCDVLISSGAVSEGDYDLLFPILEEMGHVASHKVALKPGKPFLFGRIGHMLMLGLPGNPLSTYIGYLLVVRPVLALLAGTDTLQQPTTLSAILKASIKKSKGRLEAQRAILLWDAGQWYVTPVGKQDSHRVKSLSQANGLIVLDEACEWVNEGSEVNVIPIAHSGFAPNWL